MSAATGELHQGGLVPSLHMNKVLNDRERILAKFQEGLAMLLEADQLAQVCGFDSHWKEMAESVSRSSYSRSREPYPGPDPTPKIIEEIRASVDAQGWDYLLKQSGLRTFMDAKFRRDWDEAAHKHQTPPLTEEYVQGTFIKIYEERGSMVERGVIQLFRGLSWDYKSNLPVRFGKRVVMKSVFDTYHRGSGAWYWSPSTYGTNQIDDLVRQMHFFDGKPEPDHRSAAGRWLHEEDMTGAPWESYMEIRRFKNGNAHVIFKREDLIDKLNEILGRHYPGALPAPV